MSRQEKIKKLEEEIRTVQKNKEEYDLKCTNRIRELRKKAEEETRLLKQENNEMIADAVRTIFGEVTEENLEIFMQQIRLARPTADQTEEDGIKREGTAYGS